MNHWLNLKDAARYLPPLCGERGRRRSPRFLRGEVKAGRLRAARIGARGEVVTSTEWLDAYLEAQATPIAVPMRRRS